MLLCHIVLRDLTLTLEITDNLSPGNSTVLEKQNALLFIRVTNSC